MDKIILLFQISFNEYFCREYLFENNGKRIRGNTFNKRLAIVCDKLNIPRRSIHKIRKTYATTLIDNNVSESFIKEQMGHSDISTTRKLYYLSNKSKEAKLKQIKKSFLLNQNSCLTTYLTTSSN